MEMIPVKQSSKVPRMIEPTIDIREAQREAEREAQREARREAELQAQREAEQEADRQNAIANLKRFVEENIHARGKDCFQDLEFRELRSDNRYLYRHLQDFTVQTNLFTIKFSGTGYHVDYQDGVVSYEQFSNCQRLESITFKNVTVVGENSFNKCSNLAKVIFEKRATVKPYGFFKCTRLNYLKFQTKCTIKDYAFQGCDELSKVHFYRRKVTTLGQHAFGFMNMKRFEYSGDMPQTTPPAKRQRRLRL